MNRNCATCGKLQSDEWYSCSHNMLGYGFLSKGLSDEMVPDKTEHLDFSNETDPQNFINFEEDQRRIAQEYADKGIIYGSACYTDWDLSIDGILEQFEEGKSVEDALEWCFNYGYNMGDWTGYPEWNEALEDL